MARKWSEVASSPEFQSLSPSDREAARQQYFEKVVAPQVPREQTEQVRQQFDRDTAQGAFGNDVQSGDEARARAAGDTRSSMRPEDIEFGYDTAAARGDRPEAQSMARAYVERERADSPISTGIGDRVRAFARGVPVLGGMADEANAATSALFGGDYQKRLDYERARDTGFDEAHPKESIGLQIGGGLASGVGIAARVAPALWAAPRAVALGSGAAGGATLGAADSFTRGEGLQDRSEKALAGGAIGGLFGLAAPVVGKGISTAWNAAADRIGQSQALRSLGLTRPSRDVLIRALEADGSLNGSGARNIAAAGPDAMLADAGPSAAGVLDTAVQRGGPAARVASEAVENRANAAAGRITGALDNTLGQPRGIASTETALREGSQPARSAAYDAAYSTPIDYAAPEARDLERLLGRLPANVIAKANNLMNLEGVESRQIMARIHEDGRVTYQVMPDVRQLDYITRALNDVAQAGDGAGALGGYTAEGRAYGNLARNIRDRLRQVVPEYGTALDTAAEPIAARNALQLGARILSPVMARDEVAQAVEGMSRSELDHVRQGIRSQVDEAIANVRRTVSDPNIDARQAVKALKDLSSDAAREKVRLVVGDDAAASLFRDLDEAARAFDLRAATAQNSKTFARTATNDIVQRATEPGATGLLAEGKPALAAKALVQALMGTGEAARTGRQDRIYSELVRALTEPRGPDAERLAQDIARLRNVRGTGQRAGRAAGTLISGAVYGGGVPAFEFWDGRGR